MTKNFSFIEKVNFDEKEELVNYINQIESEAKKPKISHDVFAKLRLIKIIFLNLYCKCSEEIDDSVLSLSEYEKENVVKNSLEIMNELVITE